MAFQLVIAWDKQGSGVTSMAVTDPSSSPPTLALSSPAVTLSTPLHCHATTAAVAQNNREVL